MLVNAHTHLDQCWAAQFRPKTPTPFHNWLLRQTRRDQKVLESESGEQRITTGIENGIAQLLAAETTHIGDVTRTGQSIAPLLASGLSGVVYIDILGLDQGVGDFMLNRAIQFLDQFRPQERNGLKIGLSLNALYNTSLKTVEQVVAFCETEDVPLCVHAAESEHENEALKDGTGHLYELPGRLGSDLRPEVSGLSAVKTLEKLGILDQKPLLIHLNHATKSELDIVKQSGSVVVHCPRAGHILQNGPAILKRMLMKEIPVALGTESLALVETLDVRDEAEFAKELHAGFVYPGAIDSMLTGA
ncbi:MAG: cytosine/adenosine deaminase-related metal-dependent hydrolase [Cellvibrionaceae bacterium]|jgi:cytosine/adenosine deaminase-related metal-dependent hydrolase